MYSFWKGMVFCRMLFMVIDEFAIEVPLAAIILIK